MSDQNCFAAFSCSHLQKKSLKTKAFHCLGGRLLSAVPKVHRIYFYVVIVTSIKDAFRKTISWTLVEKKGKNEILNTESFHVLKKQSIYNMLGPPKGSQTLLTFIIHDIHSFSSVGWQDPSHINHHVSIPNMPLWMRIYPLVFQR